MRKVHLPITTDASGNATVDGPEVMLGKLYAIAVNIGTLTSGAVDLTFSTQGSNGAKTLLTLTNLAASGVYYPRDVVHSETGTALTGTSGGDRTMPLISGKPRVVVAQGGNTLSGSATLYICD